MFSTYLDCAITIGSSGSDGYPTAVRGPGGDARATIAPFAHDADFQALSAQLASLDLEAELIERAGQWLFQQLFHGPIKDVYTRSQGILRDGQGLRLTLNIDENAPEIAALPWELLHDPDQGPLALLDMSVVRYLPHQSAPPALQTELPLKVLLTGAQTSAEDSIEPSLLAVEDALKHLGDYVRITIEPHLTSGKLQQLLRQDFHVWHFVGRAGVGAGTNSAQLLLEDAQQPRPVNAQQLNILLKRSGVRLVMLDMIGASGLALEPLRRLAAAVVRAQVPAAIATQFTSPDAVARVFNYEFYRALAEAFPIDACVTEGRKAVMGEVGLDQIDWACPVVYTRAADGKLFEVPAKPAPDLDARIVRPPDDIWHGAAVAVNQADGVLLYASGTPKIERLAQKPRPPRRLRGFVGREQELNTLRREFAPGGGAWLNGPQGCGLTTLLRQATNLPEAGELADGVAYVDGLAEPASADDIVHRLFERFYTATPPVKLPPASARTALAGLQALIALDSLPLNNAELRQMTDLFPDGAVLVGADGSGPNTLLRLPISGLGQHEALAIPTSEAQIEDASAAEALGQLAAALGYLPLPLLLAARFIRRKLAQQAGATPSPLTNVLTQIVQTLEQQDEPNSLVRILRIILADLDFEENAAARALAAVQGPDAELAALAAAAELPATTALAALGRLGELGFAEGQGDRFTMSSGSTRRALGQLLPCAAERSRLALYYADAVAARQPLQFERTAELRRVALEVAQRGDVAWILRERANLMAALETLLEDGRPAEAALIARALEWALATRGLWDSWARVIELTLQAALTLGDRALEAWALHERGSHAGLLRDLDGARDDLSAARRIRLELGDRRGAAASLHNMSYLELLRPVPPLLPIYGRGRRFLWIIIGALLALMGVYGASAAAGIAPTPANLIALAGPTATATAAPTPTSSPTPTASATPSPAPTSTLTPSPSNTLTPSPSPSPSESPTPSNSPTARATLTPSESPTPRDTATPRASPVPSDTPLPTSTPIPPPLAVACQELNRAVIAFYYAWYDMGDWTSGTTSNGDLPNPTYDSSDDATITRHIQQADDGGIDALACAWKGPDDARTTNNCRKLLKLIEASGRKIRMAMFADSAASGLFTEGEMIRAIGVLQSDFMQSPAYFKIQGKPVFVAWQAERMDIATWQRIRGQVDSGNSEIWFGGTDQFNYLDVFDTLFYFDISWERSPGAAMTSYNNRLNTYNKSHGTQKPFIGTVMPGYDDTARRGPGHQVMPRGDNAAYYRGTWQDVIKRRACAVMLTSFNEFYEGSYIEPSNLYGTLYLDTTKELIAQYKNAP